MDRAYAKSTKSTKSSRPSVSTKPNNKFGEIFQTKKEEPVAPKYFTKDPAYLIFDEKESEDLVEYLKTTTKCSELYENMFSLANLKKFLSKLRDINKTEDNKKLPNGFNQLVEFAEKHFEKDIKTFEKMIADKNLGYDQLESYFTVGSLAYYSDGFENIGMKITGTAYEHYSRYFSIVGEYYKSSQKNNKSTKITKVIYDYDGTIHVDDLPVKIADQKIKNIFVERSKQLLKYTGVKHVQYSGGAIFSSNGRVFSKKVKGRVMLDNEVFSDLHGFYDDEGEYVTEKYVSDKKEENTEERLFLTYPYLAGFAFNEKLWAQFKIEHISDVKYREKVFDLLVLDQKKKKLIKTLINNVNTGFKDIVDNKSGGCIILLKGKPGTGKTLTAEIAAEDVEKPLYIVSAGELGTTPPDIELQLNNIISNASKWNAVLLIDEADIFMEKREKGDILRNAIVGIFLKCLERYDGIMFLTTNRSETFDPAFLSRISVEVDYPDLDLNSRSQIWTNLLSAVGITMDQKKYDLLAMYDINGRQIKNTIRIAQCLAKDDGHELSYDIIKAVLDDSLTKITH